MTDKWHFVARENKSLCKFVPTIKHYPDRLFITFDSRYNWRLGRYSEYTKLIIPKYIEDRCVNIDKYGSSYYIGNIIIENAREIAEKNKLTVEQLGNIIKTNLMENEEMPEVLEKNEMYFGMVICGVFAFGMGIAAFFGIMMKLGVQF